MGSLSILSFNLLAPCYKRVKSQKSRESKYVNQYTKRCKECLEFIRLSPPADLYCFQEFWFQDDYQTMFVDSFNGEYTIQLAQRMCASEGLLILAKNHIKVNSTSKYRLSHGSTRISLIMEITVNNLDIIVATTHLSFPHGLFARGIQENEITNLIQHLNTMETRPIILCGDLNAGEDSVVYNTLKLEGYISTFASIHNREPFVTHRTHRKEDVLADYILYKNVNDEHPQLKVTNATVLPAEKTDKVWLDSFDVSDHRPITASFDITTMNKL